MAFDGELQVVAVHAGAVVIDGDQRPAAVAQHDVDAARAGIEAVLHQFLDRAGRPLDHLAGGDAVDGGLGQAANGQERSSYPAARYCFVSFLLDSTAGCP
jgi:hypothetical protein